MSGYTDRHRTDDGTSLFDLSEPKSVARFVANVLQARECGYEEVCAECGSGLYDESDMHARGCKDYPEGGYR